MLLSIHFEFIIYCKSMKLNIKALMICVLTIIIIDCVLHDSYIFPFHLHMTDGEVMSSPLIFDHRKWDGVRAMHHLKKTETLDNIKLRRTRKFKDVDSYIDAYGWSSSFTPFVNAAITVLYTLPFVKHFSIGIIVSNRKKNDENKHGNFMTIVHFDFDPNESYENNAHRLKDAIKKGKMQKKMKYHAILKESFQYDQVVINTFIRFEPGSKLFVAPVYWKYMIKAPRFTGIELAESPKGWYVRKHITLPYKTQY